MAAFKSPGRARREENFECSPDLISPIKTGRTAPELSQRQRKRFHTAKRRTGTCGFTECKRSNEISNTMSSNENQTLPTRGPRASWPQNLFALFLALSTPALAQVDVGLQITRTNQDSMKIA